ILHSHLACSHAAAQPPPHSFPTRRSSDLGEANIATNTAEGQHNVTKADSTIKRVMRLIDNIRQYGHLLADIYPVNKPVRENVPKLNIEDFNLDQETLESISAGIVSEHFKDI